MVKILALATSIVLFAQSAFAGWYLLQPQVMGKYDEQSRDVWFAIPDDVPLGRWESIGVFDTAKECISAREQRLAKTTKDYDASKRLGEPDIRKDGRLTVYSVSRISLMAVEQSRCVASDDPRLKVGRE